MALLQRGVPHDIILVSQQSTKINTWHIEVLNMHRDDSTVSHTGKVMVSRTVRIDVKRGEVLASIHKLRIEPLMCHLLAAT